MLVMGGCTLNSCLRVSSIETKRHFKDQGLQVVVDLSLSGARTSNFISSSMYGELSAVESAVHEMMAAGVLVVRRVEWGRRTGRSNTLKSGQSDKRTISIPDSTNG